jgi:hypothetical protein
MKKNFYNRIWIIIALLSILLLNFDTTDNVKIDKLLKQLETFRTKYAQQKIDLHTDKDSYLTGENIWMKCYLIDASSFIPDTTSKEIYVDLVDYNGRHMQRTILRNKGGFADGNILISDTLSDGNYEVYAYTNWMKNFDKNFFFNKTIRISNPNYENIVTKRKLEDISNFNKKFESLQNQYTINFFPEGGDIIAGTKTRIAFKAENMLGNGVNVSGSIYSEKGELITDFKSVHLGMGTFSFNPTAGTKYYAKVLFNNNPKNQNFDLPKVTDRGISMTVDPFLPSYIKVTIRSNRPVSDNNASNEILLVGQSRGIALYISKGVLKNDPIDVLIPKKNFPDGIAQITVFDANMEPVCERLVFIDYQKQKNRNIVTLSKQMDNDSSHFSIKLSKKDGQPVVGNLSFSVSETIEDKNENNSSNILTHLLLTSDLKGRIENPSYYFSENSDARSNLDLVMLTHGWRRFVWKDLLGNKFPEIKYEPSLGITISGKITRDNYSNASPNTQVQLTVLNKYNDIYETTTNNKGQFLFSNLNYEDSIHIKIKAFKSTGEKGLLVSVDNSVVSETGVITETGLRNVSYPSDKIKANTRWERLQNKKNQKGSDQSDHISRIYGSPDAVLKLDENANSFSNLFQYMQGRVPGVNVTGDQIIIRGVKTFYGSSEPLYLLDGVQITSSSVNTLNINDISTIEILKGSNAASFGARGANGVIAFYTKRGGSLKSEITDFTILGYQKTRMFYIPSTESENFKPQENNIPRTLFWMPGIIAGSESETVIKYKNQINTEKRKQITIEGLTDGGEIIYYQEILK